MSEWDILEGDPAPGELTSIDSTIEAFAKVARFAFDANSQFGRASGELANAMWCGPAADAFQASSSELPRQLKSLADSFQDAGAALMRYRGTLEHSQQRARELRTTAERLSRSCVEEQAKASDAHERAQAAERNRRTATRRRQHLETQLAATTVPQAAAALQVEILRARAEERRFDGDRAAAIADERRHASQADSASRAKANVVEQARQLHQELERAADGAINSLTAAERNANLPGAAERLLVDLKANVANYGPVFVASFDKGVEWFGIAAAVFPPGAAIFKGFAIIMGGLSLLSQMAVAASAKDGLTNARLLGMLSTAMKVGSLGVSGVGGRVFKYGDKAVELASGYEESGVEGLRTSAQGVVVGVGVSIVGGMALHGAMAGLNKSESSKKILLQISRSLRDGSSKGNPMIVSKDGTQVAQSILKGNVGGALPGNRLQTIPTRFDQKLSSPLQADAEREFAEGTHDIVKGIKGLTGGRSEQIQSVNSLP